MGILNVTPDSFSGDGLLAAPTIRSAAAVAQARRMVAEGADLLDIGGRIDPAGPCDRRRRRPRRPGSCRSSPPSAPPCPTRRSASTRPSPRSPRRPSTPAPTCSTTSGAPTRTSPIAPSPPPAASRSSSCTTGRRPATRTSSPRSSPTCGRRVERARRGRRRAGERHRRSGHRLRQDRRAQPRAAPRPRPRCASLGRPILLGTSRKSTLGRVLDLPAERAARGTLATTALGIAAGVDIVRVHDVRANVRVARVSDAIVRGTWRDAPTRARQEAPMTDRIVLTNMRFDGRHGVHEWERETPQPFEVDVELVLDLQPAGIDDDLSLTIDYGRVYEIVPADRRGPSVRPARGPRRGDRHELLADFAGRCRGRVRVRKPAVRLGGPLDYAGVEIRRARAGADAQRERPARRPDRPRSGDGSRPRGRRGGSRGSRWRVIVWPSRRIVERDRLAGRVLAQGRVERMLVVDRPGRRS